MYNQIVADMLGGAIVGECEVQHIIGTNPLPCDETIVYLCQRMVNRVPMTTHGSSCICGNAWSNEFEVIQTSDQPIFVFQC